MAHRNKPAPQRVRMEDVARIAGVSPATVSRALRAPASVSDALRERVNSAAQRLGYAPNRIAGSLAGARAPLIGVIVPSLTNSFFAATLERMTTLLEPEGYQLMIGQHDYDVDREEAIVTAFSSWNPAALVITGREHTRGTLGILSKATSPVVEMWDYGERPIDIGIGFSNATAGHIAAQHFVDTGRRSAAFIGAILDKDGRARARADGFQDRFQQLTGISPNVLSADSRDLGEGGNALRQVLAEQPEIQAIAFSGDMLALGAMFEASRMGLAIPDDLKILGYGDLDIGPFTNPPLSTIRPPRHEIADEVVEQILHRFAEPDADGINIDLGVQLIRRETA
ncbi:LacI family DNA-binding transcriptional regulator [Sedimentitalea sp.]|uniref:LacI family DNA-binding transcriptional regulator n=1 Tax=Sedimentitalea sp. TaxID=2048915 RepID=UPI00329904E1